MPNPSIAFVNPTPPAAAGAQRPVVGGYISTAKPVPTKRTEGAWVVVPEHSTTVPLGPCQWNSGNGKAFPKKGAKCLIAFGEEEIPRIVWWEGEYEERITAVKKPLVITGTELELEKEGFKGVAALGFENSWTNFEAGRKAEYRKNPFGTVELRGLIASGVLNKSAFILPAGYRPKEGPKSFSVAGANNTAAFVSVLTSGAVSPEAGTEIKTACFLDQISFSVE